MAKSDLEINVGSYTSESENVKTGKSIGKGIKKGIEQELGKINNGYIELTAKIKNYEYPKHDPKALSGPTSVNYSKLQKAQDDLISKWNKISEKGFSSREDSVLNVLKAYRNYEKSVRSQYYKNPTARAKDTQVASIESTIGEQITKFFGRVLGKVNLEAGGGKKRFFYRCRN